MIILKAEKEQPQTSDSNDNDLPPAYERLGPESLGQLQSVGIDGRVGLDLDSKLGRTLAKIVPAPPEYFAITAELPRRDWHIKLNIVIQVVGSRGDVQPFIALGNELQKHGHRVRLATHNVFEEFVRGSGLEFYPIGGDPAELMAYMVKNPGLIPSMRSLRQGDIQRKRAMVAEMLDGCWRSCIEPDMLSHRPFVAEAIIANPPSFAHVHCAQALGIPVHLMFTMPWSSTRAFPHPLTNIKSSSWDPGRANWISYGVVEFLTWQGLGDVINKWRHSIDLEHVPFSEGPSLAETLQIPFTYCWSPALVPKPVDWPSHIDICGFFFREPPSYTPPPELAAFLSGGPPPVYIGFGSIVIENPQQMSNILMQAVRIAGVRAIVSRGWSNLDGPPGADIFYLGDCPHEWLFQHVSAVVHHGGAGTTACGLLNARPTVVVPFFGDQPFWGNMVADARAGPIPIPHQQLNARNLAGAIAFCLTPEAQAAATVIAERMKGETGVKAAVASFHANLPLTRLQCNILPDKCVAWKVKKGKKKLRLSKLAAEALIHSSFLRRSDLKPCETRKIYIENHRWDPVTGGTSAVLGTVSTLVGAGANMVIKPYEEYKRGSSSFEPATPSTASASSGKPLPLLPSLLETEDRGESSTTALQRTGMQTAGAMAAASGKSLGQFMTSYVKGVVVDIPLAVTEGLRGVPRMYGQEPTDHGAITDWKSGAVVAGKTFVIESAVGIADIFYQPYKGARDDGILGFAKGIGKGCTNAVFKSSGATLALFAYPGQGIVKSIRATAHEKTRKAIIQRRHREGEWLFALDQGAHNVVVASAFHQLTES
ncbi:Glycosyltransferase family 1 protein [Mycena indigotica]|uniref:Glycosyltransferase family 1 protein n=1 Tax=Mycena indigotica TaxID=2126181 RepID=A0A8H6W5Q3_9AGAR|nr:Glycosyltransferase family 1 protein [Mycena indigotica]KAF7303781.1 Glycosyltransferase family 1 protein [Mycena indigotica]